MARVYIFVLLALGVLLAAVAVAFFSGWLPRLLVRWRGLQAARAATAAGTDAGTEDESVAGVGGDAPSAPAAEQQQQGMPPTMAAPTLLAQVAATGIPGVPPTATTRVQADPPSATHSAVTPRLVVLRDATSALVMTDHWKDAAIEVWCRVSSPATAAAVQTSGSTHDSSSQWTRTWSSAALAHARAGGPAVPSMPPVPSIDAWPRAADIPVTAPTTASRVAWPPATSQSPWTLELEGGHLRLVPATAAVHAAHAGGFIDLTRGVEVGLPAWHDTVRQPRTMPSMLSLAIFKQVWLVLGSHGDLGLLVRPSHLTQTAGTPNPAAAMVWRASDSVQPLRLPTTSSAGTPAAVTAPVTTAADASETDAKDEETAAAEDTQATAEAEEDGAVASESMAEEQQQPPVAPAEPTAAAVEQVLQEPAESTPDASLTATTPASKSTVRRRRSDKAARAIEDDATSVASSTRTAPVVSKNVKKRTTTPRTPAPAIVFA